MTAEPEKPVKRNWGLWLIIAALAFAGLLAALPSLLGGGSTATDTGSESCTLQTYRSQATPLMNELNDIIDETDIRSASSRSAADTAVTALLVKINRFECRDAYPLKQETLAFAARHFRDAMRALDDGDATAAGEALDAATLNASRFNNWSVDVGN